MYFVIILQGSCLAGFNRDLLKAINTNDVAKAKELFNKQKPSVEETDGRGDTLLHKAVRAKISSDELKKGEKSFEKKYEEIVILLVNKGVPLDIKSKRNETALSL